MRTFGQLHRLPYIVGIIGLVGVATQTQAQDAEKIDRLERLIKAQQQQLEYLQQQLNELKQTTADAKAEAEEAKSVAKTVVEEKEQPVKLSGTAKAVDEQARGAKVVTSGGGERVKLAISGHVNRMVNIADDGGDTESYFVDNDNSESQVRFVGTAEANQDVTLGAAIELSIAPNKSGNVDQRNQETNNVFDQRKAEVILESERYGKVWFGKGNTASYQAGAVDLSRTVAISYSTIVDTAGGLFFRERDSGELTDVRIGNAFNSFDGLNRRNRIRYDSPKFGGFHLQTSAVSDDRYDGSLWWSGQGYGFKAAGALAIANPNEDDSDLQYNGSFSALHEYTGLNASLSFGVLDREDQDDQQNFFAKLGWRRHFFSIGETAFSVDYTRSLNLPTDRDDSYSVAAAAVQQVDDYGAELFALYRFHSLDRDIEPDVDNINVVSLGTRVKF